MIRPVCVQCHIEFRAKKNGVSILIMTSPATPYQLFMGDLWQCPICGTEIVSGFGLEPLAESWQDTFGKTVQSYSPVINVYAKPSDAERLLREVEDGK